VAPPDQVEARSSSVATMSIFACIGFYVLYTNPEGFW
jgi:hypothetical protein